MDTHRCPATWATGQSCHLISLPSHLSARSRRAARPCGRALPAQSRRASVDGLKCQPQLPAPPTRGGRPRAVAATPPGVGRRPYRTGHLTMAWSGLSSGCITPAGCHDKFALMWPRGRGAAALLRPGSRHHHPATIGAAWCTLKLYLL